MPVEQLRLESGKAGLDERIEDHQFAEREQPQASQVMGYCARLVAEALLGMVVQEVVDQGKAEIHLEISHESWMETGGLGAGAELHWQPQTVANGAVACQGRAVEESVVGSQVAQRTVFVEEDQGERLAAEKVGMELPAHPWELH